MSGSAELLALRLGLIGILLVFIVVVAAYLSRSLRPVGNRNRSAGPARARLMIVRPGQTGLAVGTEFPLAGATTLGRDEQAGIQLGDVSVSGRHALIERRGGGWLVRDLGSTNGTLVRGRPAGGRGVILAAGDTIAIGVAFVGLAAVKWTARVLRPE